MQYKYNSLEDFLATKPLSVDGEGDDGGGVKFPVKGREIQATILFSDISGFSGRTLDMSSTETLIFVNNFFTWITTEALRGCLGIVDKYIGDEIMVVFSQEFGSQDAFEDAVQTARRMCENDHLAFTPHVGIASGIVTVGYVGTPVKYNCSVFGSPVALAARCASIKPEKEDAGVGRIVFPAAEWVDRPFDKVFPPTAYAGPKGKPVQLPAPWKLRPVRKVPIKNMGEIEIREACKLTPHHPHEFSAETQAKEILQEIQEQGRYWPRDGRLTMPDVCAQCGEPALHESPKGDRDQRKPCPKCGSLDRRLSGQVDMKADSNLSGNLTVSKSDRDRQE